jgi:hypothetical protein
MRARSTTLLMFLAAALAATLAACFDPLQPSCAFSCGPNGSCPAAYTCGGDGLCHRDDGAGTCGIAPSDGGAD